MQLIDSVVFVKNFTKLLHIILVSHLGELFVDNKFINSFMYCLTSGSFNAKLLNRLVDTSRVDSGPIYI